MFDKFIKYFFVFFIALSISAHATVDSITVGSSAKDHVMVAQLDDVGLGDLVQVGELCPLGETDIIQLEAAASETIADLELVQGLLETLLVEDLVANLLAVLDPLLTGVGLETNLEQLNTDLNNTLAGVTALINDLELFIDADMNEQCALAANICVQGQDLVSTTDGLVVFLLDSIDSLLTIPVSTDTLDGDGGLLDLGLVDDLLGLLGGITDPVLEDLLGIDPDNLLGLNLSETLDPLLTQLLDLRGQLLTVLTPAAENVVELSCALPEDSPDPEMCEFVNDSPNCSDPNCSEEEIVEGVNCEEFNENPEEFCSDEVSCDDPNCEGIMACMTGDGDGDGDVGGDNTSTGDGGGSGGDGCGSLAGPVNPSSFSGVFLPLLAIGGILALRIYRRKRV